MSSKEKEILGTESPQVRQAKSGGMIVGISERLDDLFGDDDDSTCEVPEDFKPPANEYETWLG